MEWSGIDRQRRVRETGRAVHRHTTERDKQEQEGEMRYLGVYGTCTVCWMRIYIQADHRRQREGHEWSWRICNWEEEGEYGEEGEMEETEAFQSELYNEGRGCTEMG